MKELATVYEGFEFRCYATISHDHRRSESLVILAEIVSVLQQKGYAMTKAKPANPGVAISMCKLEDGCGIDVYIWPSDASGDHTVFMMVAMSGMYNPRDAGAGRIRIVNAWSEIAAIGERVVSEVFSAGDFRRLSGDEIDARSRSERASR
jgi:hypothetical protein